MHHQVPIFSPEKSLGHLVPKVGHYWRRQYLIDYRTVLSQPAWQLFPIDVWIATSFPFVFRLPFLVHATEELLRSEFHLWMLQFKVVEMFLLHRRAAHWTLGFQWSLEVDVGCVFLYRR